MIREFTELKVPEDNCHKEMQKFWPKVELTNMPFSTRS